MAEPQYKAVAFNSVVRNIRALAAPEAFAEMLAALTPETRALIERPPLPIEWLPYQRIQELVRTALDRVFAGDVTRMREVSRRAITQDMNAFYRVVLRIMSPESLIQRGAKLWETYWKDNGTVSVERCGERHVEAHFVDLQRSTPLTWELIAGTIEALAEMAGGKQVQARVLSVKPTTAVIRVTWR